MKSQSEATNLGNVSTYQSGITQSTAHRLLRKFTDECLDEYDITTMQWFILGVIHDAGETGISMTTLSKRVETNVPYITNTLNKLESKSYVQRYLKQTADGRIKLVRIHPDKLHMIDTIESNLRAKMRSIIYQDISPAELSTYIRVLNKLTHSLSK